MDKKNNFCNEFHSNLDSKFLNQSYSTDRRSIDRSQFKTNKRLFPRTIDKTLNIEINLNFPKGLNIVKPIAEISDKGLSFYLLEHEGFFEEGSILKNIKIFNNEYESIVEKGKILYYKEYKTEESIKYKVGLVFLSEDKNSKKRATRFQNTDIKTLKTKVSFFVDGEEHRGQLLNFSKHGILLLVKSPRFVAQKSSILENINIVIDEKNIYKGNGVVIDVVPKKDSFELRIALKDGIIFVDDVLSTRDKHKVDVAISEMKDANSIKDNLSEEFKNNIHSTYYLLNKAKEVLDKFESEIKHETLSRRNFLIEEVFTKLNKEFYPKLDCLIEELDNIFVNIDKNEIEIYRQYFQSILHPLMMFAPILNRIYTKPLNIAGDYEMMNIFYRNKYEGETLFGKFLNKYICCYISPQTIRTRTGFMSKKTQDVLDDYLKKNEFNKFKITNIASGSALEIQELIKSENNTDYVQVTLLDFLEEAIKHSSLKINKIIKEHNRNTKFNIIQESIFNLIKDKNTLDKIQDNQNIIYSVGLFEYLSDTICIALLEILFDKLGKGGVLIIGNYKCEIPWVSWMELGLDWYLNYRSKESLLSLAKNLNCDKVVETESLGLFQFLVLKK